MYPTASHIQRRRDRRRVVAAVLTVVGLIVAFAVIASMMVQTVARENGCEATRDAIMRSSMQCAAIEGAYPASLEYLEQNYGLVINHKDYLVTYECFAENIAPTVVVTSR